MKSISALTCYTVKQPASLCRSLKEHNLFLLAAWLVIAVAGFVVQWRFLKEGQPEA